MLHNEAKEAIKKILGDHITFEGHFDMVFGRLKENRQKQIMEWVKECREGKSNALSSDKVKDLLAFVLRFRDTNLRAILTKKKNEYFIALFLDMSEIAPSHTPSFSSEKEGRFLSMLKNASGFSPSVFDKHKYYENERRKLGI